MTPGLSLPPTRSSVSFHILVVLRELEELRVRSKE